MFRCLGAVDHGILPRVSEADDPVESAWRELLAHWTEEAAHKKFIALAQSLDRLADAGKRYREARDAPESLATYRDLANRSEIAKKGIDSILGAAMVRMATTRTPPPTKKHPKLTFVALGICTALILYALWAFIRMQ